MSNDSRTSLLLPDLNLPQSLGFGASLPRLVRSVSIRTAGGGPGGTGGTEVRVTLVEAQVEAALAEEEFSKCFELLRGIVLRMSFGTLQPLQVIAARLIEPAKNPGEKVRSINFVGIPPGTGVSEVAVGFQTVGLLSSELLGAQVEPRVEVAMQWFMAGCTAGNSIFQTVCFWTAIEALAPEVQSPFTCECGTALHKCPKCQQSTDRPRVLESIRRYLGERGIDRKEVGRLYELRSKIVHGRLTISQDTLPKVSASIGRLQEITLSAIRSELAIGSCAGPLITSQGIRISSLMAMACEQEVDVDTYQQPAIVSSGASY